MFKCRHCENTFSERAFFKGDWVCPHCGSEETEGVIRCSYCGDLFFDDELKYGVCEQCVEDLKFPYKYDPVRCYKLSAEEKDEIWLNSFLLSQFNQQEIEEILLKEIIVQAATPYPDYSSFINEDEMWFIEKALEEVKKSE